MSIPEEEIDTFVYVKNALLPINRFEMAYVSPEFPECVCVTLRTIPLCNKKPEKNSSKLIMKVKNDISTDKVVDPLLMNVKNTLEKEMEIENDKENDNSDDADDVKLDPQSKLETENFQDPKKKKVQRQEQEKVVFIFPGKGVDPNELIQSLYREVTRYKQEVKQVGIRKHANNFLNEIITEESDKLGMTFEQLENIMMPLITELYEEVEKELELHGDFPLINLKGFQYKISEQISNQQLLLKRKN